MLTFLVFFLILSTLVLIHEAGHFFAAKWSGVKVHEFGLGLPPKLFGKKFSKNGTEYTFNALPIGGFVRLEGEDPSDKSKKSDNFNNKKPLTRLFILCAGVLMNLILAIVIYYIFFAFNNYISNPIVNITEFDFKGAQQLKVDTFVSDVTNEEIKDKVKQGDTIVYVKYLKRDKVVLGQEPILNAGRQELIKQVSNIKTQDFIDAVNNSTGEIELGLLNIQNSQFKKVQVTPKFNEEVKRNVIGVSLSPGGVTYLDYSKNKLFSAFNHSYNTLAFSFKALGEIFKVSIANKDVQPISQSVSGPVGIFVMVGIVLKIGGIAVLWTLLDLMAMFSLSLALMNILPIPALDGGRCVFVLYELITGKKPNAKFESTAHKFGMIFLLSLILLITFKDVFQFFIS